jgi:hypothetical protein
VSLFEETDIMAGVHVEDRVEAEIARDRALEPERLQAGEQGSRPVRVFERFDDPPMDHVLRGPVVELRVVEEKLHDGGSSKRARSRPGCNRPGAFSSAPLAETCDG